MKGKNHVGLPKPDQDFFRIADITSEGARIKPFGCTQNGPKTFDGCFAAGTRTATVVFSVPLSGCGVEQRSFGKFGKTDLLARHTGYCR